MTLVTPTDRYLWVNDRATNDVVAVKTGDDIVNNIFSLVSRHSTDPAPDLMAVDPKSKHAFISLRGPCPLTANIADVNNAVGATPGVMVVKVEGGKKGKVQGIAPINNVDPSIVNCAPAGAPLSNNRADPHSITVRSVE